MTLRIHMRSQCHLILITGASRGLRKRTVWPMSQGSEMTGEGCRPDCPWALVVMVMPSLPESFSGLWISLKLLLISMTVPWLILHTNLYPNRPHFYILDLLLVYNKAFSCDPRSSARMGNDEISNLVLTLLLSCSKLVRIVWDLTFKCLRFSISLTLVN